MRYLACLKCALFAVVLLQIACSDLQESDAQQADRSAMGSRLTIQSTLGASQSVAGYRSADQVAPFNFPVDHGAHPQFRSEWWYMTAVLREVDQAGLQLPNGRTFGVQYTLFRQAVQPVDDSVRANGWQSGQVYLAHLALSDVASLQHREAHRLLRGHPSLAGVQAEPFTAVIDDWRLEERDEWERHQPSVSPAAMPTPGVRWRLSAHDVAEGFGVELGLHQRWPIVLQGDRGLSHKGPNGASYYYSIPQMSARGEVVVGNEVVPVAGEAWFDREWSTSLLEDHLQGWAWFALNLGPQRSFMGFKLVRRDGARDPYDYAAQFDLDDALEIDKSLVSDTFTALPKRFWQDIEGYRWPVAWELGYQQASGERVTLWVEALFDDQLMDKTLIYWEGIVGVFDAPGGNRVGTGYLEMTGYNQTSQHEGKQADER